MAVREKGKKSPLLARVARKDLSKEGTLTLTRGE